MLKKEKSFINWLKSEGFKTQKFIGLSSVLIWLYSIYTLLFNQIPNPFSVKEFDAILKETKPLEMGLLAAFQAGICFLLIFVTPRSIDSSKPNPGKTIIEASDRIVRHILSLYGTFGFLYMVIAFFLLIGYPAQTKNFITLFETITMTAIFFLFVELSKVTVASKEEETQIRINEQIRLTNDAFRDKLIFTIIASGLILLNILSYRFLKPENYLLTVINHFVGLASGVLLVMLVGRLSIIINPGTITLSLLSLYGVIQAFAGFFESHTAILIATSLALLLKVLLWLVFVWAFTTGKLWDYIEEIRELIDKDE